MVSKVTARTRADRAPIGARKVPAQAAEFRVLEEIGKGELEGGRGARDPQQNTAGNKLERVNLLLSRDDSAWLDALAAEIRANTGARVSRSEIVRAALSIMAELYRVAPTCPDRLVPLDRCKSGEELAVIGLLAVRWAALP